jgi:beta-glucanase (GH16 family)
MKPARVLAVALLGLLIVPSSAAQKEAAGVFLPPAPAGKTWELIWHDEFEGTTLDETKWNRLGDWKRRDGFWVKEDAYLSGRGTLVLRTKKEGDRYTCGAVNTKGKFEHAFGYYVARCKMPEQPGHWPAFWMMSSGVGKVGNEGRDGTEIDIMELPWRDGRVTFNLHWDGYGEHHKSAGNRTTIPELTDGFHDYALLWTPEEYVFYVDGREVWRSKAGGVSQVKEYLKLTEEIGKWGGDIDKAELPDYFEVDYVRVYAWSK